MSDDLVPRGPFFGGPPLQFPQAIERWSPLAQAPVFELQRASPGMERDAQSFRLILRWGRRALVVAGIGLALGFGRWSAPAPPAAPAVDPATPTRVIAVRYPRGCTLRARPSVDSAAIGRALPGESYDVEAFRNGWRLVTVEAGVRGWVGCR